jgi:prepilin-type N-terminal cleavage/methylation domain-containing protein
MPPEAGRSQEGFTLIEILISLSIFLLVLLGIYELFDWNRATYVSSQRKVDVQQNARVALDEIVRQIRMAGYFPENFATPPAAPLLANPIQVATDVALAIYGDADGSGASSVFLFCLDGSFVRRQTAAQGVVTTYTCTAGQILAENVTSLQFTYYDTNNTAIPNPPTPAYQLDTQVLGAVPTFASTAQRGAVRTVLISLTAREDVPGQPPQVYTLTSSVRLRNL